MYVEIAFDTEVLLRDFGPYGVLFGNMCRFTIAMVMLLRDFRPYGIIFMNVCVY
jgi:fluoride ion exporter CrcB/FEX